MRKQLLQLCLIMLCYGYSIAQPSKTATYQNQAASLILNNQYEKAIHVLELAAEAHKIAKQWPNYFSCLNQITNAYLSLHNYVEAKRMAKETLWESISILGRDNNESAKSAHQLAEVYSLAGRYTKAEEYHLMGLKIRRSIYGDNHPDIADSQCKLAKNLEREKKYEEAEDIYQQALALQKNLLGENHSFVANTLYALGALSSKQNDLETAKSYHLQSLQIREKTYGPDHHKVAQSYYALSQIDKNTPNDYLKSAADIYVLELSEASIDAAICLFKYGNQLFHSGRFDHSTPYAQRAANIFNVIGEKHSLASPSNHLIGTLLYEDHALYKAITYFEKAIDSGHQSPLSYHLLINAYQQLEQYDQAIIWTKKYVSRAKTEAATVDALLLMADNQIMNKDWDAAQRTLVKIKKYDLSPEETIYTALHTARLQYEQQNYEGIINTAELPTPSNTSATLLILEIEALSNKAAIQLAQQGRSEMALLTMVNKKYDQLHQNIITLLNSPLSSLQCQKLDALQAHIYDGAIECNYLLYEQTQEIQYVHAAFTFSEKSKAIHLSLYAQNNHLAYSNIASINQHKRHYTVLDHQIKGKWLSGENASTPVQKQKEQIENHRTSLVQLEKESPETFSLLFQPEIASVTTFNTALSPKGMYVLSYFFGEKSLYVFSINEEKISMSKRDKSLDLLNQIERFSRLCQQSPQEQSADELNRSFRSFIQYATSLKEILVPFALEKTTLDEEQSSLLILPHENLAYFPFEALCLEEENVSNFSQASYLGNHMATLYHYSASSYLQKKALNSDGLFPEKDQSVELPYWDKNSLPLEKWNQQDTSFLMVNRFDNQQEEENIIDGFIMAMQKAVPIHKAIQYSRLEYLQKNINQPLNAHPYYWAGYCFIGKPSTDNISSNSNNFPYWILAAVGGIVLMGLWVRKK